MKFKQAKTSGDEVVEVAALEWIFFEGEVFVGAQIVNPEL